VIIRSASSCGIGVHAQLYCLQVVRSSLPAVYAPVLLASDALPVLGLAVWCLWYGSPRTGGWLYDVSACDTREKFLWQGAPSICCHWD
jgi:hypothetical protein